jgi:Arc/MetJ family transcription regulator
MSDSDGDPWDEYLRWNYAVAELWFSTEQAHQPTYIDVDEDLLNAAGSALGLHDDPVVALAQAVAPTVRPAGGAPFAEHSKRLQAWRRHLRQVRASRSLDLEPPPVTALLGAFTVAAYQMGPEGGVAPNAYFPRLFDYLGVPAERHNATIAAFRRHSEDFWRGLNEYLVHFEGQRGLPTAFSLGFRYVGIPQSQALVRAADRMRLPGFFRAFGLPPGAEVAPGDLERLLDAWIGRHPSPVSANLVRLWRGKSARPRIADVVAVELSLWDGSYRASTVAAEEQAGDLALTALVRRRLGGEALELSFAARFSHPIDAGLLEIASAGSKPRVAVIASAGGTVRPAPGSHLDATSLLAAQVEVRDPETSQSVRRLPRRVVPMHKDDLLGAYVETERLLLAEDAVLFVKDDASLVKATSDLLDTHGRHDRGYAQTEREGFDRLAGVPDGWVLFVGVQMLASPQTVAHVELNVLTPVTTARVAFTGGLKLPGRVRKWSTLCPPVLNAVATEPEARVRVELAPAEGEDASTVHTWEAEDGVLIVALEELGLKDGDYEITFSVNNKPVSRSSLRLRSSSTPDLASWESSSRLVYDLSEPTSAPAPGAVMSATALTDTVASLVDGAATLGSVESPPPPARALPSTPHWLRHTRTTRAATPPVVLGQPDPKSCLVTGAHHWMLPTWSGKRSSGLIEGRCKSCNLVKRFPPRPKPKGSIVVAAAPPKVHIEHLPPRDTEVPIGACLDALIHVGGGPTSSFERVATQADGSSLFTDDLLRSLEVVGQIDVRRDERCQPVQWEVPPAHLAGMADGRFVLRGVWTSTSVAAFAEAASEAGGAIRPLADSERVPSWVLSDLEETQVLKLGTEWDIAVVPLAAETMLAALPSLGTLETTLSTVPIPTFTKAEKFHVDQAGWVSTPGIAGPGAYRLTQSFRSVTLWVDHDGARDRTGRLGSVQLVKHLAAKASEQPLLAFLPGTSTLVVPLGADLPGLYGRVAAICSGLPPLPSPRSRALAYPSVPRSVAEGLAALLTT